MKEKIINITKQIQKEDINSMLIAILCVSGLISFIISIDNIIPIIIGIIFIALETINYKKTIKRIKEKKISFNNFFAIFVGVILIVFLTSICFNGMRNTIKERFLYFIFFLIIPYMCCRHGIKVKSVINSTLIISAIITIPLIFIDFSQYDGGNRMAISYYMLPTYIAIIMNFFVDDNKTIKKILAKIVLFSIVFFPYIYFLVAYASRGVLVAIFICIVLNSIVKKSIKHRLIILLIILIITSLCVAFIGPIFKGIDTLVSSWGIKVEFISKNANLYDKDMIDNGRNKVYTRTIEGIMEHPIIGNGIGAYAEKYVTYPHNLLLQAWYEGGIVFFFVMLFVFIYSIYILVFNKDEDKNEIYLLIFFSSISLVRLMLSYEFWREISFGMYLFVVFYILKSDFSRRRAKKNGNNNNTNIQKI